MSHNQGETNLIHQFWILLSVLQLICQCRLYESQSVGLIRWHKTQWKWPLQSCSFTRRPKETTNLFFSMLCSREIPPEGRRHLTTQTSSNNWRLVQIKQFFQTVCTDVDGLMSGFVKPNYADYWYKNCFSLKSSLDQAPQRTAHCHSAASLMQ